MTGLRESATTEGCGLAQHLVVSQTHHGRGDTSVRSWAMGDGVWLMNVRFSGLSVSCPRNRHNDQLTRRLTFAVLDPGDWTLVTDQVSSEQQPGHPTLVALDQSSIFDFRALGHGSAIAVHITHPRLTLSIETVRRGLGNLHSGIPLYALALDQIRQLGAVAEGDPHLLGALTMSTVSVVRSLLISAADVAESVSGTDGLITSIERHVENHLGDPDLGAATIAAAHHISVRQLYKCWPQTHGTLAGYIASRRLAQARTSLLTHQHLSIAAIAQKHGFTHATHFTQLFRVAYGITPSGWRRAGRTPARQR